MSINKIKQWWKRRRELKQLEKSCNEKIKKDGMDYMFRPPYVKDVYGRELRNRK